MNQKYKYKLLQQEHRHKDGRAISINLGFTPLPQDTLIPILDLTTCLPVIGRPALPPDPQLPYGVNCHIKNS